MTDRFDLQRLELHRRFIERTSQNAQTLSELTLRFDQAALGPSAREQLRYIAHNLAGAAGTFGFPGISATAAELEDRLLSPGRTDIGQSCRALITQLRQVTASRPAMPLRRQGDVQQVSGAGDDARVPEEAPGGVLIVARTPELERLSSVVAGLGYTPIDALTTQPGPSKRPAAALISDAVPEALQICRRYSPQVPVLLVGTDASFHGRLAAARMGTTGVLPRPVDASELADWLEELAPRDRGRPHSILIVEGDRLLADTYALELESAGMRCEVVTDGAMTLDRIAATNPDLVLLETRMPGINGIELARIIRQSRRDLALPIVFLSSESDPLLQLEARTLGGDDFIEKPVDREGLVALIRLRARRGVELRSLMERDGLTGLANHGRFMDRLTQELERCRRTQAEVTLAMIDLDHLQAINEQFGHMGGDAVIRALAQVLVARLRRIDVVGRYDGDRLAAILLDTAPELVGKVLDQIREGFASLPFRMADTSFTATASIGVAGSRDFPQIERLIGAAEAALADAKQAGRNSLRCAHAAATPGGAPVYSGPAMPH